jgi:hypothetical protein
MNPPRRVDCSLKATDRETDFGHGKKLTGSIQRRSARHHNHYNGVGIEGATWNPVGRLETIAADLFKLRP